MCPLGMLIVPLLCSVLPAITRRSVVFPAPLFPTSPILLLGVMNHSMESSTVCSPKFMLRFFISIRMVTPFCLFFEFCLYIIAYFCFFIFVIFFMGYNVGGFIFYFYGRELF